MSDFNVALRPGQEMSMSTNEHACSPGPDGLKSSSPGMPARPGTKKFMGKGRLPGKAPRRLRRPIIASQQHHHAPLDDDVQSPLKDSLFNSRESSPERSKAEKIGTSSVADHAMSPLRGHELRDNHDISVLSAKSQTKRKLGISAKVALQNSVVEQTMTSMECQSPTSGVVPRKGRFPDPAVLMGEAHENVSALRAQLSRIVQHRSSLIVELFDKVPHEFSLFPNIKANFKLALSGVEPPLKLNFSYSDQSIRSVIVYWHYDISDPSSEASVGHQHNPK